MTKEEVRKKILEIGIVPVVRAASAQQALQAAAAVCAGGIPIVEITMTVPGAIDVIAQLAKIMGNDVLIGAGTVLDAEAARRCIDAGAEFLVSPKANLAYQNRIVPEGQPLRRQRRASGRASRWESFTLLHAPPYRDEGAIPKRPRHTIAIN